MTDHDDHVITRDEAPADVEHVSNPTRWSAAATLARALGTASDHPEQNAAGPDVDEPRD